MKVEEFPVLRQAYIDLSLSGFSFEQVMLGRVQFNLLNSALLEKKQLIIYFYLILIFLRFIF